MKIQKIEFKHDEDFSAIPETITVEMTLSEAVWIAKVAGKQRGESPHSGIYSALVGDVFNRYWDNGVDDAYMPRVEIPPIKYDD